MTTLLHTSKGLQNLPDFYEEIVIYVEGQDDKVFWSFFFEKVLSKDEFHIKSAGGWYELRKYADCIVESDAKLIIASDSHYSVILNKHLKHPRIVYTFGYSIENTIYCPLIINRLIRKLCRLGSTPNPCAQKWIKKFCEDAEELIHYDIANELYGKGLEIMGDKCDRFLKNNSSPYLSPEKISGLLITRKKKFSSNEIKRTQRIIKNSGTSFEKIIRGHFLRGGVTNFLRHEAIKRRKKSITVPSEMLFVLAVEECHHCGNDCEEFRKTKEDCMSAIATVR